MKNMTLDDFKYLCKPSIFALVNQEDRRIYLSQSSNTLLAISQLFDKLNKGFYHHKLLLEDYRNNRLELVLYEETYDEITRKIRLRELQDRYRNMGYLIYNRFKSSRYRLRIDYKVNPFKTDLYMVSNDGSRFLVGRFNTTKECEEFIQRYYGVEYGIPVYANNEDTKVYYMQRYKKK